MKRVFAAAGPALWAIVFALSIAPFTVGAGLAAAVLGCFVGSIIGRRLARTPIRLAAIWILGIFFIAAAFLFARLGVGLSLPARILGAELTYQLGEAFFYFGTIATLLTVLEASSARRPLFTVLQFVLGLGLVSTLLAAHRYGFINRPHSLVDGLWVRGWDPVPVFLGVGALAAAGLILNLMLMNSKRKTFSGAAIICALIVIGFLLVPIGTLTTISPPPGGNAGGGGSAQGAPTDTDGSREHTRSGFKGDNIMSSLSDQPDSPNNLPVAVVVLRDDYDSPLGYYYFRQTAFSQYNGIRLIQDTTGSADRDLIESFPAGPDAVSFPITHTPFTRALRSTVALIVPQSRPFALTDPASIIAITNPNPSRFRRAYEVESYVLQTLPSEITSISTGSVTWNHEQRRHYTEGSSDNRYLKLAEEIISDLAPEIRSYPFAQALASTKFCMVE